MIISRINSSYHLKISRQVIQRLNIDKVCCSYSPKHSTLKGEITDAGILGFDNSMIHNCHYQNLNIYNDELSNFLNSKYYYYFNAMIRRSYPIGFSGDLQREKNLINYYLNFWQRYIDRKEKILILWDAPHFPHEYILLYLAKKLDYKILILSVMCGDRVFFMNEDFEIIQPNLGSSIKKIFNREFLLFRQHNHDDYNKRTRSIKSFIYRDIFINFLTLFKSYFMSKTNYRYGYYGAMIGNKNYTQYLEKYFSFKNTISALRAFRYYERVSSKIERRTDTINIFIPLTCKYENSVDPLWGHHDVFTLVDFLNSLGEKHNRKINIYIKEHPLNFVHRAHQYYPRDVITYSLLKTMKNVHFVSNNVDSFDALRRVDYVLSGGISTITLQCIALNIPVLTIGVSPFFPGLNIYENLEDLIIYGNENVLEMPYKQLFSSGYFQLDNIESYEDVKSHVFIKEIVYILNRL